MATIGSYQKGGISSGDVKKTAIEFTNGFVNLPKKEASQTDVSEIDMDTFLTVEEHERPQIANTKVTGSPTWYDKFTASWFHKGVCTGFTFLLALNDGALSLTEKIVDGAIWSTKLPFDLICFIGGKTISLVAPQLSPYADQTQEMITGFFKDVIAFDTDGWLKDQYMSTQFAKEVNRASYLDYTGTSAKTIGTISEKVQTYIGAAISSKVWGGCLAIMLGGCYGSGEQAEKIYQDHKDTTFGEEFSILGRGALEAAKWFCVAKTVQGFSGGGAAGGAEGTGTSMGAKAKALFSHIKQRGFFKTHGDIFKTMFSGGAGQTINPFTKYLGYFMSQPQNIVAVTAALGRNIPDYITGDKEFTLKSVLLDITFSFTKMASGASGLNISDNNGGGSLSLPIWGIVKGSPWFTEVANWISEKIFGNKKQEAVNNTAAAKGTWTISRSSEFKEIPNENVNTFDVITDLVYSGN